MVNPTGYTALDLIGFTDKGTYLSSENYVKNDLVHYGGNIWRCLIDDTSRVEPAEGVNWTLFIEEPTNLVERIIAPVETNPATNAYAVGKQLIFNGLLCKATSAIAVGDTLAVGTNLALSDNVVEQIYSLNQGLTNSLNNEIATRAKLGGHNLFKVAAETLTIQGVTFTRNSDGSFTVNGTASGNIYYNLSLSKFLKFEDLDYILTGCPSGGSEDSYSLFIRSNEADSSQWQYAIDYGNGISFLADSSREYTAFMYVKDGYTISNKTFYPMIRLATDESADYEPYSMTNREMTPYVQSISNPNLLDNPWFTVNQRGQSSYGANTFSLDRWRSGNNNQVAISGNVVTLSPVNTSQSCVFYQVFEDEADGLNGKTVTLSLLDGSGNLYTVSHVVEHKTTWTQLFWKGFNDSFSIGLTAQPLTDGKYRYSFDINTYATKTLTIKAVKLELGSVSTLAQDTAPNYQQELAKCQRYFYRYKAAHTGFYFGLAIAWNTNKMSMILTVPCMRSTATITPSDFSDFLVSKGASSVSPHNITNFENLGQSEQNHTSGLLITTSESDLTSGDIYVLKAVNSSAYIDFSADL